MSMQDLLKAFNLIELNKEKSDFDKEYKNEELVSLAEKTLDVNFPSTYRLFLKQYGSGGIGGMEIYGIIDENLDRPGIPNGIWVTNRRRKIANLPKHFIIIASTGDGFDYALDASETNEAGEYPVVIWGFGEDGQSKMKVAEDFGEFLLQQLTLALEDEEVASQA